MTPFILLDDARSGAKARLFRNPVEIVRADRLEDVVSALDRLRGTTRHAAGFIAYEAGCAFEPRLRPTFRQPNTPLL